MKTFKRRDSATALLRKLGIKPENYNLFISLNGVDFFCDIVKAKQSLHAPPIKPLTAKKSKKSTAKIKPVFIEAPSADMSTRQYIRQLISSGYTNKQINNSLIKFKRLDLADKHKFYHPTYYRFKMRKEGFNV